MIVDHILERLHYDPAQTLHAGSHPSTLTPIPWESHMRPMPRATATLPLAADAVIITWTFAEWKALTDVLAPAAEELQYAENFPSYLPDLTDKSPARDAHCLARYRSVLTPDGKVVLLVHSMLHVATDGPSLPLRRFLDQLIDDAAPERLITVGTGGGLLADQEVGDIVVGQSCWFNCKHQFADAPFAHAEYRTTLPLDLDIDPAPLLAANTSKIPGRATSIRIINADIETVDYFGFGTSTDIFGLIKAVSSAGACEMDDAVFGLVIEDRMKAAKHAPLWLAIRNVSDPVADMLVYATEEEAAKAMAKIYKECGYFTSIGSAILAWLYAAK